MSRWTLPIISVFLFVLSLFWSPYDTEVSRVEAWFQIVALEIYNCITNKLNFLMENKSLGAFRAQGYLFISVRNSPYCSCLSNSYWLYLSSDFTKTSVTIVFELKEHYIFPDSRRHRLKVLFTLDGRRKRGRPKETWRRTVEKESEGEQLDLGSPGTTNTQHKPMAHSGRGLRCFQTRRGLSRTSFIAWLIDIVWNFLFSNQGSLHVCSPKTELIW